MDEVVANKHTPVLVAPDNGSRGTPRKTWTGGRNEWMRTLLKSEHGRERYKKRKQTTEPTFGNAKTQQGRHTVSPTRQDQGTHRMATTDDDREPHQGPPSPDSRPGGLKTPSR